MRRAVGVLATVALLALAQGRSEAGLIFSLQQVGPDVVLTGSGTVNLAGLGSPSNVFTGPGLVAITGVFQSGDPTTGFSTDFYTGITGPGSIGPGGTFGADSGAGPRFGIRGGAGTVVVPAGYVSGDPLSGSATFDSTTLASLGVTPGVYTWTWGSGANADSAVLYLGVPVPVEAAVPEPASLALLGLGAAGLLGARWRRRGRT